MSKTTCQICEREIKASTGVIAHHGYQRPDRGSGWQTSSCWGARHLPYEQSCDQIPVVIQYIKDYIARQQKSIVELLENPPQVYLIRRWRNSEEETLKRPEGFDPKKNIFGDPYRGSWTYEQEHWNKHYSATKEIKHSEYDLHRLEKRLAAWIAPQNNG